jgi:hypothetical protein
MLPAPAPEPVLTPSPVEENMALAQHEARRGDPGRSMDKPPTDSGYLPYGARVAKGGGGGERRNRLSGW